MKKRVDGAPDDADTDADTDTDAGAGAGAGAGAESDADSDTDAYATTGAEWPVTLSLPEGAGFSDRPCFDKLSTNGGSRVARFRSASTACAMPTHAAGEGPCYMEAP